MSLSTQTLKRLPAIKEGLLKGLNYTQIGGKCGVTEKTIDRDIGKWVESGEFETWIKTEFLRLHTIMIHEYPLEAYKQISKIMAKMVTRKAEIQERLDVTTRQFVIKMWMPPNEPAE